MRNSAAPFSGKLIPDFQAFCSAIPGPVVVLLPDDPVFTVVAVNPAYERAAACHGQIVVGRGFFALLNSEDFEDGARDLRDSLRRVLATKAADRMPARQLGRRQWVRVNSPVLEDGVVTHVIHCLEDVSEAERSRHSEEIRAGAEMQGRERRNAFLVRLDDATRALTDPQEITQTAARLLTEHLQVNRCAYAEVEEAEGTLHVTGDHNDGVESTVGRYPLEQCGAECLGLMREGQPYVVADAENHAGTAAPAEVNGLIQARALICVPLLKAGRWAAGMAVHQSAPRQWRPEEVELVQVVANRCWESIERARVARELQDGEQRLKVALDTAGLGSWQMQLDTGELKASSNCRKNFGMREDQSLTYRELIQMIHPEDRTRVQAAVDRSIRERVDYQAEYRISRGDGKPGWIVATGRAIYSADGAAQRMVGVTLDVTDRKMAEAALRESEERFRQLANSMPQMVWTARPDGYLDYYNERWYAFTGFDSALGGDQSWEPILHPDDTKLCYEVWYTAVRTGQPYEIEYRFWDRFEKRWRWFIGRALPVRDATGQIVKWFGSCTDIDEQKTTQQAVLQTQKLESIGLLAGGVAHDFNNLLVGIMGNASFALDTIRPSHPAYPMLKGVVDASERAAHLTRQMLAYAGKGRFVIEPVNLSDMVVRTAELVSASIPKSVQVKLQVEEQLPVVLTDAGQMQQVAMNLIINGAEAIGENRNGLVIVRTRTERIEAGSVRPDVAGKIMPAGLYAALEVQDTGCGIDSDTLTKIFDPFFTTKFTGRGLGLAAVLGIVRSHQGAIEVETVGGKGTTFRVLLPAERGGAMSAPPRQTVEGNSEGHEKVLVIDDEAIVRNLAKAALGKAGYSVLVAGSGAEGLECVRRHRDIALVLLDMSMPEMSGRQVLEMLHSINPSTPVVICSGYSEDEVYQQFSGLKMAGVLQKPFTSGGLIARVRAVLDRVSAQS